MPYRFKARSSTPGEYRLAVGVLAQLLSAAKIIKPVDRGDGVLGTLDLNLYQLKPAPSTSAGYEDVFQFADGLLVETFGVSIIVSDGINSVVLNARIAQSNAQTIDAGGSVAVEEGVRDYLIATADLSLGGATVKPARGMRITETIDGIVRTFELLPISGQACYAETDPGGKTLLIHTKEIATS
jgi:hypothetical protein